MTPDRGKAMAAKYAGTCHACGLPIALGAPIKFFGKRHPEHPGTVWHQRCESDLNGPKIPRGTDG